MPESPTDLLGREYRVGDIIAMTPIQDDGCMELGTVTGFICLANDSWPYLRVQCVYRAYEGELRLSVAEKYLRTPNRGIIVSRANDPTFAIPGNFLEMLRPLDPPERYYLLLTSESRELSTTSILSYAELQHEFRVNTQWYLLCATLIELTEQERITYPNWTEEQLSEIRNRTWYTPKLDFFLEQTDA